MHLPSEAIFPSFPEISRLPLFSMPFGSPPINLGVVLPILFVRNYHASIAVAGNGQNYPFFDFIKSDKTSEMKTASV